MVAGAGRVGVDLDQFVGEVHEPDARDVVIGVTRKPKTVAGEHFGIRGQLDDDRYVLREGK